ncbi:NACHT domain-containing protein [Methylobacterium sp. E-041]|uniref:NACHT domain-containing protein n=1 Tax=Methylobacterium sp. E-041 TaxID=2836573 RepID=UPI001FB8E3FE|nr:NACHT domain-containing protein [Methylobacterium sp. E-041]MCJ2105215.1 NACHT domain-containing protein [Methylobacterium sp. E-041]
MEKKAEDEEQFVQNIEDRTGIVITGIAGSGKSMFMKHLFIRFCSDNIGLIPIFVELRSLESDNLDIIEHISRQISNSIEGFTKFQLEYGLKNKKFILLLDGLDEVDSNQRDDVSKNIVDMFEKYDGTPIIVSSRPDGRFAGWNQFYVGHIEPLSIQKVKELISRIDYDETIKIDFIEEVESRIFETHQSFLSNPLLCTMMLMTFTEFAEIPNKMHVFYSHAFDVLFSRHDRMKASFKRKFYTELAVDDFKKILSVFCALTYMKQQFVFTENSAADFAKKSIDHCSNQEKPANFIMDLSESISFLLLEGDELSFIHRSFQEYFTAIFLAERTFKDIESTINKISSSRSEDQVIELLYEINSEALEIKYIRPKMKILMQKFDEIDLENNPAEIFSLFYLGYMVDHESSIQFLVGKSSQSGMFYAEYYGLLALIERCYPSAGGYNLDGSDFDWSEIIERQEDAEDDMILKIDNPTNIDIIGTPLFNHISLLFHRLQAINNNLELRQNSQEELLLHMFDRDP